MSTVNNVNEVSIFKQASDFFPHITDELFTYKIKDLSEAKKLAIRITLQHFRNEYKEPKGKKVLSEENIVLLYNNLVDVFSRENPETATTATKLNKGFKAWILPYKTTLGEFQATKKYLEGNSSVSIIINNKKMLINSPQAIALTNEHLPRNKDISNNNNNNNNNISESDIEESESDTNIVILSDSNNNIIYSQSPFIINQEEIKNRVKLLSDYAEKLVNDAGMPDDETLPSVKDILNEITKMTDSQTAERLIKFLQSRIPAEGAANMDPSAESISTQRALLLLDVYLTDEMDKRTVFAENSVAEATLFCANFIAENIRAFAKQMALFA